MGEVAPGSQGKIVVFGAKQIRRSWVDDQWFFSVVDIVGALTDSASPAKYWDAMKRREKASSGVDLSTFCRKVPRGALHATGVFPPFRPADGRRS